MLCPRPLPSAAASVSDWRRAWTAGFPREWTASEAKVNAEVEWMEIHSLETQASLEMEEWHESGQNKYINK